MKLYVWRKNICHVSVARDRNVLVNTYIDTLGEPNARYTKIEAITIHRFGHLNILKYSYLFC